MVAMVVVGAFVVGALALTAYPSGRGASVTSNAPPEALAQPVHAAAAERQEPRPAPLAAPVDAVAPTHVPRAIDEKPKKTPVLSTTSSSAVPARSWSAAVAAAEGRVSPEPAGRERTASEPADASTTTPDTVSQSVTLSGCLEATVAGDQFRLTDTDGADAPKARGWRSGFLKKRSAPVDLVELSDPVGLRKYVGLRVTATGLLTNRELRVRSLQAAGTSCN
jgi:hypothetical protein